MSFLGELSFFLGLQISQLKDGTFISQTKYIKEMLKILNMEECKPVCTPMINGCKLSKEDEANEVEKKSIYGLMIWILLYVVALRCDMMQVVGLVAIFQDAPK